MPTPVFQDAGAGAAGTTASLSVPYPATVNANDCLILQLFCRKGTAFTASGWTSVQSSALSLGFHQVFAKIAAGTEGGTSFSASMSGTSLSGFYGRIYRLSSVVSSSFTEAAGAATGTSTTVADQSVTTTGATRLAVNLVALCDDLAIGSFSGETGGTWTEAISEFTASTGAGACLQLQTAAIASAGTINGGTTTVGTATSPGTNEFSVVGFALKPAAGVILGLPVETDTALPMTASLTPSGLRVTLGVPSETDSALAMTAATDATADIKFYTAIDFDGFERVDSRLQQLTVTRGRATNLDQVDTGTAQGTWDNGDGVLDPSNTASPYYGLIVPLQKLRILRRKNTATYELFTGGIERYEPSFEYTYQRMNIGASDSLEKLSNTIIVSDRSTLTTALSGSNNDLTFTAVDAGEDGDSISVTYAVAGNNTALATATNQPLSGSGIMSFRQSELHGLFNVFGSAPVGTNTLPAGSVSVSGSDITVTVATDGSGNPTSTANAVLAALQADPECSALVTVELAAGNTGAGIVAAMPQTFLTGGQWPAEASGARINRVLDLAGWPSDQRAVDDGTVQVTQRGFSLKDNQSALAHIQDVADSELGYCFMTGADVFTFHDASHRSTSSRSTTSQATFSDDGSVGFSYTAINPSYDKDRIVNECTVTGGSQTSIPQTVDDTYSQTGTGTAPDGAGPVPGGGFGVRSLSRSTQLASDADASAQATSIVDAYAYPRYRFDTITTIEPQDDAGSAGWVAGVLPLDIGDLVTVRTTPPVTSGNTTTTTQYDAFVEQVTDELQPGQPWKRTLKLSLQSQSAVPTGGGGGTGGGGDALTDSSGDPFTLDDAAKGLLG